MFCNQTGSLFISNLRGVSWALLTHTDGRRVTDRFHVVWMKRLYHDICNFKMAGHTAVQFSVCFV